MVRPCRDEGVRKSKKRKGSREAAPFFDVEFEQKMNRKIVETLKIFKLLKIVDKDEKIC